MVTVQITNETMINEMQLSDITSSYNSVDENSTNPISETISILVNETFINIFLKKDQ